MAGEAYALSADLVEYIATHEALLDFTAGAEDKRVAKWMRLHPEASSVNWITERCWVYDHPKAGTTYSHGFLYPDQVERIREEGRRGLSKAEKVQRGGERYQSYSTVSTWKGEYQSPEDGMTIEEEIESLVEGGGRWSSDDYAAQEAESVRFDTLVFEQNDPRLIDSRYQNYGELPTQESVGVVPGVPDRSIHLPIARTSTKFSKDFLRDPSDVKAVQLEKRGILDETVEQIGLGQYHNYVTPPPLEPDDQNEINFLPAPLDSPHHTSAILETSSPTEATPTATNDDTRVDNKPTGEVRHPAQNFILPPAAARLLSPATLRYDPTTLTLREKRMLNRPHGGTVAIHFLKRNEWFLETALAILGRDKTWDSGLDTPSSSSPYSPVVVSTSSSSSAESPTLELSRLPPWAGVGMVTAVDSLWGGARMYGSPVVRSNGYICEGRIGDELSTKEYIPNEPTTQLGRLGRRPGFAVAIPEGVDVSGAGIINGDEVEVGNEEVKEEETITEEQPVLPEVVMAPTQAVESVTATSLPIVDELIAIVKEFRDDSPPALFIQPLLAI
jgi:hypothetical protein